MRSMDGLHRKWTLRDEARDVADQIQIRRLSRLHAGPDSGVKTRVVTLVSAAVPYLQQLPRKGAVVVAIHRRLVVLAAGDKNHCGFELAHDRTDATAADAKVRQHRIRIGDTGLACVLGDVGLQLVVELLMLLVHTAPDLDR